MVILLDLRAVTGWLHSANGGDAVVTKEGFKKNAAKISNASRHFGVRWMNLEESMANQDWNF
jgi:hypothetical protein